MAKPVILEKREDGFYIEDEFACKEEDLWQKILEIYFDVPSR